jgi:hypothetical protein
MFRPRFEAIFRQFVVEQLIRFLHMDVYLFQLTAHPLVHTSTVTSLT